MFSGPYNCETSAMNATSVPKLENAVNDQRPA